MSESLKKVTLFCKLGSEKVLKDNVLLKEIPRPFVFQKLVRRGHLKIFLGVSLGFFLFFFLLLFFVFLFFSFCFVFLFFFVFFLNFLLGFLLYSGCSFTCSRLTNVVFKGIFFFFFSSGLTNVGV